MSLLLSPREKEEQREEERRDFVVTVWVQEAGPPPENFSRQAKNRTSNTSILVCK